MPRTITIAIPDELAAHPDAARDLNAFAVAALAAHAAPAPDPLRPYAAYESREAYVADARAKASALGLDPDAAAGVAAGLADAAEGRVLTADQVRARQEAHVAAKRRALEETPPRKRVA